MSDVYKKFSPELYEAVYQVEEEQDGMRLDQYCASFLPSFSRQQIKKKIKDGEITIFKRPHHPHKASVKVYHREQVEVRTPRANLEDEYWDGEKIDLQVDPEIVFEDENILAISKPAYMATHPSGKHLFNCATVYFENLYKKPIYSIHRLDRETSGVLLLAKSSKTAQICTSLFEKNLVSKIYFFVAHNDTEEIFPITAKERLGLIENFVPRNYNHCFTESSSHGKHAETTFFHLHIDSDYIIGLACPKTGRQHQIRCHAAVHGFPLVGDKLYNGDPTIFMRFKDMEATDEDHDDMVLPRHALHALALKIAYPSKENPSIYKTLIPKDLRIWMEENIQNLSMPKLRADIEKVIHERFYEKKY